jgi:tripartite-type tricarboxylate transporter receptor subunit TctC
MPHVQTGGLRALAVATTKRSSNAPNIPTIAEWMARVTARSMPLGSQTPNGESETVW